MDAKQFSHILDSQSQACYEILGVKADEYADEGDRLHNFKIAAELAGTTPKVALAGMMAKHTVSIYDMIHSPEIHPVEQWTEKITDHINYLFLLKAIVVEDEERASKQLIFNELKGDTTNA